ncbi:MAG: PilZ domain-containing protein, partial [Pirellulaceae bacterium]
LEFLLDRLQASVHVPNIWQDYFLKQGLCQPRPEDRRQFVRRFLREDAVCEIRQTLPVIPRRHEFSKVYLKDISKGGIGFLMSQQLFPCEQVHLWTRLGRLSCNVMRCAKQNERCYEIGARFA